MNQYLFKELEVADHIIVKENGVDALEFIKHHCINQPASCVNLILLDLNMPIMGGLDLLEELKKLGQAELITSRIVVLTSSTHPKDISHLREVGVKIVLEKPLTTAKIKSLIRALEGGNQSFFIDTPSN